MTDDERFERDLAAVVHQGAPDDAPDSLRHRVGTSMRAAAAPSTSARPSLLAAAFGLVLVVLVTTLVAPRFLPDVAVPAPSSSSLSMAATPPPTAVAT